MPGPQQCGERGVRIPKLSHLVVAELFNDYRWRSAEFLQRLRRQPRARIGIEVQPRRDYDTEPADPCCRTDQIRDSGSLTGVVKPIDTVDEQRPATVARQVGQELARRHLTAELCRQRRPATTGYAVRCDDDDPGLNANAQREVL